MSDDILIARKRRIDAFLADEAVIECIANMKWKCYDDFRKADSNEQRIQAQARARVLEDFADELELVRSRGETVMLEIAERERKKRQL